MKKHLALVLLALLPLLLPGVEDNFLHVDPADSVIVLSDKKSAAKKLAADELQYHLQLVTGIKIPVLDQKDLRKKSAKFTFYVGIPAPSDSKPLLPEEGRWQAGKDGKIYFYGDDVDYKHPAGLMSSLLISSRGSAHAVYDFLNNILGIKHIEPGKNGIVYEKSKTIKIPVGNFSWRSSLEFRLIRSGILNYKKVYKKRAATLPREFVLSKSEYKRWEHEVALWQMRQRFRKAISIQYGHSFRQYWPMFGKTHPEYFAMNPSGKRGPGKEPLYRLQLCMSNPAVADMIVNLWKNKKSRCLNICPNDSSLFCICPECKKFGSKSDLMIHFMNEVSKRAVKIRKDVQITTYAYQLYMDAPEKIRVPETGVIGFVSIFINLKKMEEYYKNWKKMGCKKIFLRPNTFHVDIGLPLGYEKDVFNEFQLGRKYGIFGVDVDSLSNTWSINGIAPYILARSYIDPEKPFEYWEDEYCQAFGSAREQIKKYFQFIRKNIWEGRVGAGRIQVGPGYDNLKRYIAPRIRDIVDEKIYRDAGNFLEMIDLNTLSPDAKRRVELLKLANNHAILTTRVIHAPLASKMSANKALLDFRRRYKNTLNIFWYTLLKNEESKDLIGMTSAAKFGDCFWVREINDNWYFDLDEKNVGEKEKWYEYPAQRVRSVWSPFFVTKNWEWATVTDGLPPRLLEKLRNYDGIGWYSTRVFLDPNLKGRKIYLHFGGVDEACTVYVNGKKVGTKNLREGKAWRKPFDMEITPFIDWKSRCVNIFVRVEDSQGVGGIWKGVWLKAK